MKRRVIVAVLFVLALVALVSVGCGGAKRQDAEAIKGTPWTGSQGRTVSVRKLAALDRSEPWRPSTSAPEEAAGAEAVGEAVREKPEPGEERTTPKRAGSAIPEQRTGENAISPSQAVTPQANFLGAQLNQSNFVPPDSMGAVGPSQILVSVNGRIRVYDKQGHLGGLNLTDSAFWAPVRNGFEPTDPGVEYDRLSQRWIVSAVNVENANNRVMLAVSDGQTITSASDFTYYFFNEASPPPPGPARFADYPQLGVDANAIYIGVNEFSSSSGGFTGTSAYVIRKSSVINGGAMVVTAFRNLVSGGGAGPDSPQPATDMDPNVGAGYIVGPDNAVLSRIDVRRITDPGGTPSISGNLGINVPTTAQPLGVPAQGTPSPGLDALDDRLFEAMIGRAPDGNVSLWTAHNIRMDATGNGSGSGDRDGAQWYQLGSLGTSPSLVQSGRVFDTAATNPAFYWMPSIAMSGQGHASINMSTAGVGKFAQVASSGRLFTDAPGTTEAPQITQTSTFSYNVGHDPPNPERWGDYSQTVVDPNDNMTFWTFQEYANAPNSWGVQVIQLQAPPPATPSLATPGTVSQGSCSVGVQIEGTSTDGSGFFDSGPDAGGPGYANRIAARVSGGVAVNGVTYVDPTHVVLDLDTRSATTGTQDVTITNPDGQEETATGLLTVDPPGTGPAAPCFSGTDPDSPANQTAPKVLGSADPGSTVKLYKDPGCPVSQEVGTGTAEEFALPGIAVDPVSPNSTTVYYATATDAGSHVSPCSSTLGTPSGSVTYVEDETAPELFVDSGPSGATTDKTPTFAFHATDAVGPISFQCSIDTGTPSFGACSGPGDTDTPSSPLADGSYTFRVKATDAATNTATATQDFSVETPPPATTQPAAPPDTAITKGPKKKTTKRRPKFKFTSTQPGSTFQCQLDKDQFKPCTSPFRPPKLGLGKHVLRVRAIGPTGAADPAPAVKKFKVIS